MITLTELIDNKSFSVQDFIDNDYDNETPENVFEEYFGEFSDMASFFRKYPDYFLDYIKTKNTRYDLTPFQRVILRAFFRYKRIGIVATRGTSKTWVHLLGKYLRCVLYPGSHEAVAFPTKEQSAKVATEKILEFWADYPLLKKETIEGSCKFGKDYIKIVFKNGSTLDTLAMTESSRGLRANGIGIEEITDDRIDPKTINEVILPIADRGRTIPRWGEDLNNEYQMTQAWVTTASHKQSYAYDKFRGMVDDMRKGKPVLVLISDYRLGVKFGTVKLEVVEEKKNDPSYSPLSFDKTLSFRLEIA